MATVIDSLIVSLGLDNKDFQKGMKDTEKGLSDTRKNTDRVGKQIAASGKDAAEFFGQMQRSAIKFFAVLTAGKGLINFTRDVVSTGANLSRLSKNLNISADTMHRWGKASELNGGSMEGFLGALQDLNGQITEIQMTGTSSMVPYFRQLGVSIVDAAGNAKSSVQIYEDVADAVGKIYKNQNERYAYLKRMGIADEGLVNLMAKGGKELRSTLAAQQGFSQKDADAAYKAEQTWIKAQQRLEKLTRELVIKVLPSLERLAESFVKMAELIIPPLSQAVEIFAVLDEKTAGWSTSLLLALATLRLIGGSAVIGGLAGLSATMAGLAAGAASLVAPLGAMLYSGKLNSNEDEALKQLYGENYMGPTLENKGPDMSGVNDSSPARRNRNPGNINFAGQKGATKNGRFAKFETVEAGVAQMYKQLAKYEREGLNTIEKIISRWAPESENGSETEAYIREVSKRMGIDRNAQISMANPAQAASLISAMARQESGWTLTDRQLWGGVGQAHPMTQAGAMSGINMAQGGGGGSSSVSIGQITINTQATDSRGLASGLKGEVVRQFDAGLR